MRYKFDIPDYVNNALGILHCNGYEAYIVGGSVRDLVMGNVPHDYDITTNALPYEVISVFSSTNRVIETGLKHGTVTVLSDGNPLEITTYRVDGKYSDCRRPEHVTFTPSLEEDLKRRDFTVNALVYNEVCGIADYFNGISDIEHGVIKCIGNPIDRFKEDALRILRALRFAVKLDFEIDTDTSEAILNLKHLLGRISAERIFSELQTMFSYSNTSRLSAILIEYKSVFESVLGFDMPDSKYVNICMNLSKILPENNLGLIYFLCKICPDRISLTNMLSRLKASNSFVSRAVAIHGIINVAETISGDADIKILMRDFGADVVSDAGKILDSLGLTANLQVNAERIISNNECYSLKQLDITGKDIITSLDVKGKAVGKILDALLELVIHGKIDNNKQTLIDVAKQLKNTVET